MHHSAEMEDLESSDVESFASLLVAHVIERAFQLITTSKKSEPKARDSSGLEDLLSQLGKTSSKKESKVLTGFY